MGKLIPFAEFQVQQRVTRSYLRRFDARLPLPGEDEGGSGFVLIACVVALAVVYAAAWACS